MNMTEYLERDKESLIRKLEDAGTIEKAEHVVRDEFDRLLLQYNENCDEPYRRDVAALLIQTARLSSGLVNSVGETKIWEQLATQSANEKSRTLKEKITLASGPVAGILAFLNMLLASTGKSGLRLSDILLTAGLMLFSLAFTYRAGQKEAARKGLPTPKNATYQTENRINPQHTYTCMHNILVAADQDLDQLQLPDFSAENAAGEQNGPVPTKLADLFSDLLEAHCSGDGDYALNKIQNVKYYLHQNGIEVVTYDGNNKELFDFLPSMKQGTFRPALVAEGKVLKRGLASEGL